MSDVFVSYKREDRPSVALLVDGLKSEGFSVWWDQAIAGGERWRSMISQEIDSARCVIVVWSKASVGSQGEFVHEEASRAKTRGVLLPIRIEKVAEPIGFGEVQSLDLVGWRGRRRDRRFRNVLAAARAMVSGQPRPQPMTTARELRRVAVLTSVLAGAGVILSLAADLSELERGLCRVPGIRSVCRGLALGGVPTQAEENLWLAVQPDGCDGLRKYLGQYPDGAFSTIARSRLDSKRIEASEIWLPEERPLPLAVPRSKVSFKTVDEARTDAITRAAREAKSLCSKFVSDWYRVVSSEARVTAWNCLPWNAGYLCGFEGEAVCQLEARRTAESEICP